MTESNLSALRARADNGDRDAADELIQLAGELGDADELRRLADQGNATAADQLIELATERGDLDTLRHLAKSGNRTATDQLVELASERCDLDELRRLADQGNTDARDVLMELTDAGAEYSMRGSRALPWPARPGPAQVAAVWHRQRRPGGRAGRLGTTPARTRARPASASATMVEKPKAGRDLCTCPGPSPQEPSDP